MKPSLSVSSGEAVKDIMLMVALKKPRNTHLTVWGEKDFGGTLYWEDMFEILDIYVNGKPFHGLATPEISVHFTFSNKPMESRTLLEKLTGVGPMYWGDFCVGYEGHYCLFLHLDIARFDYISGCDTFIVSSRDFRRENGKPLSAPLTYEAYAKQQVTSVVNVVTFHKHAELPEGGGGKRKPKPSLKTYFESMPEEHRVFN